MLDVIYARSRQWSRFMAACTELPDSQCEPLALRQALRTELPAMFAVAILDKN